MTRSDMTGAMSTALNAALIRPLFLLDLETSTGTLYFNTALDTLSFNSQSYLGGGQVINIPSFDDTNELRASQCFVNLNPSLSSILSIAFSMKQSYSLTIYLGLYDTSLATNTLIASPIKVFKGKFDHAEINEDPNTPSVRFVYESELLRLLRPGTYRYSPAVQQSLFPGDRGFEYLPKLDDWLGYWGKAVKIRSLRKRRDT